MFIIIITFLFALGTLFTKALESVMEEINHELGVSPSILPNELANQTAFNRLLLLLLLICIFYFFLRIKYSVNPEK